ncbi:hypothetical protein MPH_05988 [Macrophomina phaseolina MS6]|uniref:Uncharacterized protein n=1 Tax=Macrophomina phaseolina (strain MS6) TaxID=1126212 RepID=K2SIW0_MACPH|nr:hypothetical protein MPH_05988 [Macrophomina phaseolina MS6]
MDQNKSFLYKDSLEIRQPDITGARIFVSKDDRGEPQLCKQLFSINPTVPFVSAAPSTSAVSEMHWAFVNGKIQFVRKGVQVSRPAAPQITTTNAEPRATNQTAVGAGRRRARSLATEAATDMDITVSGAGSQMVRPGAQQTAATDPFMKRSVGPLLPAQVVDTVSTDTATLNSPTIAGSTTRSFAHTAGAAQDAVSSGIPADVASTEQPQPNQPLATPLSAENLHNIPQRWGIKLRLTGLRNGPPKIQVVRDTAFATAGIPPTSGKRKAADTDIAEEKTVSREAFVGANQSVEPASSQPKQVVQQVSSTTPSVRRNPSRKAKKVQQNLSNADSSMTQLGQSTGSPGLAPEPAPHKVNASQTEQLIHNPEVRKKLVRKARRTHQPVINVAGSIKQPDQGSGAVLDATEPALQKKTTRVPHQLATNSDAETQHQKGSAAIPVTTQPASQPNSLSKASKKKRKLAAVKETQETNRQPVKRGRTTATAGNKKASAEMPALATSMLNGRQSSAAPVQSPPTSTTTTANPLASIAQSPAIERPVRGENGFELIGPRHTFVRGVDQSAFLTIHYYINKPDGTRTRHAWEYPPRKQQTIDWNSDATIAAVSKWYNQYLAREGCDRLRKGTADATYREPEMQWLRDYNEAHKDDDPRPKVEQMRQAFNERWVGVEVPYVDKSGQEMKTAPREERTMGGFSSFVGRKNLLPDLKKRKRKERDNADEDDAKTNRKKAKTAVKAGQAGRIMGRKAAAGKKKKKAA